MNTLVDRYVKSFQNNNRAFLGTFGALTPDELNLKPNAASWSIAQNMEHLILTNESYYPVFEKIKNGSNQTPWIGKITFITKGMGNMIINSVKPETKRKTKTFKIWEPDSSFVPNILSRFETHHQKLIQELKAMELYIDKGIIISSPANHYVVYGLEQGFEIMVVHEQRHYQQACNVLSEIKK